jgi:hypothetical protein
VGGKGELGADHYLFDINFGTTTMNTFSVENTTRAMRMVASHQCTTCCY